MRGGTCWVSGGSFFCACKTGLSGDRCQGIVVVIVVVVVYLFSYFFLSRLVPEHGRVDIDHKLCLMSAVVVCCLAFVRVVVTLHSFRFTLNLSFCLDRCDWPSRNYPRRGGPLRPGYGQRTWIKSSSPASSEPYAQCLRGCWHPHLGNFRRYFRGIAIYFASQQLL